MDHSTEGEKAKKVISWAGGNYRGDLKEGIPSGWGRLVLPDGTKYDGEWFKGKPQGRGTITYGNGGVYRGDWFDGQRHGEGKYTRADGKLFYGQWAEGKFLGPLEEESEYTSAEEKPRREAIKIRSLTYTYPGGKGIFDLTFDVFKGEIFGFLGPNGAGKTTTIRNLLGFVQPQEGECSIYGLDCWDDSTAVQKGLGYLPGEIAIFDEMRGSQFLNLVRDLRGGKSGRRDELLQRFELNPEERIRRMSKGMKQKLGLVAAFMHDPAVYILDEPTSGLDPLMQSSFVELILEEKERGKTVLMSSHNFEETYRTCDRAGIIREGRLVAVEDVHSLKTSQRKAYLVSLGDRGDLERLKQAGLEVGRVSKNTVEVFVSGNYGQFIAALSKCKVLGLDVATQSLEQIFLKYYGQEGVKH